MSEERSRQWRYVNLRNTCFLKPSHFMMSSKPPCRKETETIWKNPVRHADELEINLSCDKTECALFKHTAISRYCKLETSMPTFP